MDIRLDDIISLKKAHPCGSKEWRVIRVGADFKLVCLGCNHMIMVDRGKIEKKIRKIVRDGEELK